MSGNSAAHVVNQREKFQNSAMRGSFFSLLTLHLDLLAEIFKVSSSTLEIKQKFSILLL